MEIFNNSKEFKNHAVIKPGDEVNIGPFAFVFDGVIFTLKSGGDDDLVFEVLGIENKVEFCTDYYKYDPVWNYGFPRPKLGDYEALTRVVVALMKIHENNVFWAKLWQKFKFW